MHVSGRRWGWKKPDYSRNLKTNGPLYLANEMKRLFDYAKKNKQRIPRILSTKFSLLSKTPCQRYVEKVKDSIATKTSELFKLESNIQGSAKENIAS